jgi:hypothetical protein
MICGDTHDHELRGFQAWSRPKTLGRVSRSTLFRDGQFCDKISTTSYAVLEVTYALLLFGLTEEATAHCPLNPR